MKIVKKKYFCNMKRFNLYSKKKRGELGKERKFWD